MSSKANHFRIGLFVVGAAGVAAAASIILGGGAMFRETVQAETYLDESVTGLEPGAAVKYRGVKIGQLEKIDFVINRYSQAKDVNHGRQVLLSLAIDPAIYKIKSHEDIRKMIDDGLRIRMASGGLTGGMYLEVDFLDPARNPPMAISWTPGTYYIPSAPSTGKGLMDSVERILAQLERMKTDELAAELRKAVADISTTMRDDVAPAVRAVQEGAKDMDRFVARCTELVDKDLSPTVARANQALKRLDGTVADQQDTLDDLLDNFRRISADLNELTGTLKRHPSSALFGDPPPRKEKP